MKTTINELATKHGTDYVKTSGLVNFLVAKGIATKVGSQPNPTGKGKGASVYEMPETVELSLS